MSLGVVFPKAQACVWMEAGVISFWLCSRDFDCDHCPLDAALRGGSALADPVRSEAGVPGDRLSTER